MILLASLVQCLAGCEALRAVSLGSLIKFIRLAISLKPVILHLQKAKWRPSAMPELPRHVIAFLAGQLGTAESAIRDLWAAMGASIWLHGSSLLEEDCEAPPLQDPDLDDEVMLSDHMLYPSTTVCTDPLCNGHGRLLRLWDDPGPKRITMFSLAQGVFEGYAVATSCRKCRATYYPNYVVRGDVRQYYEGIPEYVQVSDHVYVERALLEHFTMLSVLSWTSATNAAHIYHESMSHLPPHLRHIPRFQLRTEHTWDGFVLLALLRDADDRSAVLEVPNTGEQKDRFTAAMLERNQRIRFSGQPEYAHWCQKCHRRFDDDNGVASFVDCIITDGISIGRPCCSVQNCREPLRTPQEHWCALHASQASFCIVDGCCYAHRERFRTCHLHASVEDHHIATGQALFTLRMRLQRAQVTHPTDAIDPDAAVDEDAELDVEVGPCPEKPIEGNQRVRARFGRRRTHNEQLIVRPCGIITSRETFYGAETIPQVLDMLHKKYLVPGSMPRYVYYDNNCGLYKHCAATEGELLHTQIGLPVDVFHWTCKHKKSDVECSYHCNPHMFPELLDGADSWYFNSSRAEQTNVWFGGYHAIVREMGAIKYEFFLDEMILRKNELTRVKLEECGWTPGYRDDIRFADTDVSA